MESPRYDYEADVVLADGGSAHLRPRRRDDDDRLAALFRRVADRSRYLRFFSPVSPADAARLEAASAGSPARYALVAEIGSDIVATAEYDLTNDDDVAEIALTVQDDQQGRGLGTSLLEGLAQVAATRGIRCFTASFLISNIDTRDVFAHTGVAVHWRAADCGVAEAVLELTATDEWARAHAQRERVVEHRSLARLLSPDSIAVVGVGRRDDSIGRAIVENLVGGGYRGSVYPVNPHTTSVSGLSSYPSVQALPQPLDLVVIAVPAALVVDAARECAASGARNAVVISGGFAELDGGAEVQDELVAVCRGAGMRLVGPNCVGVVNTDPAVRMNATFSPVPAEPGRIGFASQSGGVGIELLARARERGLGVSSFVSLGNKADVSSNDLLQYWAEDSATDVMVLYLESFGNPRKLARLRREISDAKPIVVMKSGRTSAGARGARSHTAALADSDRLVDELLHETGVVRVDTLEELFDTAALLVHQPVPRGRRVAVMSNGGGPGIIAADASVAAGLEVPALSPALQEELRAIALPGSSVQNPVDLIAAASPAVFRGAGRALLASDEVDALIALYVAPHVTRPQDIARAMGQMAREAGGKPVAACLLGLDGREAGIVSATGMDGVPVFAYPESAARAVGRAVELGEWRRRPRGAFPALRDVDGVRARCLVSTALTARPEGGWLDAAGAQGILGCYGIPVVATHRAADAGEARRIADGLGYPVVLKAAAPELVHKSDVGGVALGLASPDDVTQAFARMERALGSAMGGAVVQPMVPVGVELIVGITRDERFGPFVVFGMGGLTAELQRDTVIRIPPLTDVDVASMIEGLRGSPLLFGYRSTPPVNVVALSDLVARVGQLAEDIPEIAELDCNPVIVSTNGAIVVDAKLRLAPELHPRTAFDLD